MTSTPSSLIDKYASCLSSSPSSLDPLCSSSNPDDCTTPFQSLPFQQRIANRKPSSLCISTSYDYELDQDQNPSSLLVQQDHLPESTAACAMPFATQSSLRRHVLIKNALLQSIRQDRDERLNQLKQAYFLPDQDQLPLVEQVDSDKRVPMDVCEGQDDFSDDDSEMENGDRIDALKEARAEVKREMKRELRVRNIVEPLQSSSESEEESDGAEEVGYDSDESLSDSEEYYRDRNRRFNTPSMDFIAAPDPARRSISSLTCSASVSRSAAKPQFPRSEEPVIEFSRPSATPMQASQAAVCRPKASPLQSCDSSRPQLSLVQSTSPAAVPSRPPLSTVRPSLSLIKELSKSQTIPSTPTRPSLAPSTSTPSRPSLSRSLPVINQEVQRSVKISTSSDEEDEEEDESRYGKVYTFGSRRNSEESTEEEWFDDLLNEVGTSGKSSQLQTTQLHRQHQLPSDSDEMEGIEMEGDNGTLSSEEPPNSPSFSLSDSDSSEVSMSYPNSLEDVNSDSNSNSSSSQVTSAITTPCLSSSATMHSSPTDTQQVNKKPILTSDLQCGISAWRDATRSC